MEGVVTRYRTIVADPPWRYRTTLPEFNGNGKRSAVPYDTLGVDEIAALPIRDVAERDAHLYLWTTQTHLEHSWEICRAWGFKPSTILVWCKKPRGFAGFPTYNCVTEYVLFCRRGTLAAKQRVERNWFEWSRGPHSAKPEAFLDMVETVSPGPYLELFARRQRLGWDTWGDEALQHVEVAP